MTDLTDLTAFIQNNGGELVTDSRAVAIAFGKRHKNVMQTIDRMRSSERLTIVEHARLNFQPCTYIGGNGRPERMFRMTADGLSELAMSFSGDDAREVRIRFIAAFRAVAQRLVAAEKSITSMLHDLDRRAVASETKGRIGSMLMHGRRKEKPRITVPGHAARQHAADHRRTRPVQSWTRVTHRRSRTCGTTACCRRVTAGAEAVMA